MPPCGGLSVDVYVLSMLFLVIQHDFNPKDFMRFLNTPFLIPKETLTLHTAERISPLVAK